MQAVVPRYPQSRWPTALVLLLSFSTVALGIRVVKSLRMLFLLAPEHPREGTHGFRPPGDGPPEALSEGLSSPGMHYMMHYIVPKTPKCLFEQAGAIELDAGLLDRQQPHALVVGEVPGIFKPDVAVPGHPALVLLALFPDLFATQVVHGPQKVATEREPVEGR